MFFLVSKSIEMRNLKIFYTFCLCIIMTNSVASDCFDVNVEKNNFAWEEQLDTITNTYITAFKIPGVVVLAGNSKGIIFEKAYGNRSYDKDTPNTVDTIYDLASITKLFTATAVMQLLQKKKIYLGSKLKTHFPENYVTLKKQKITVEDLLRHNSGYKAGVTSGVFTDNLETTWENILNVEPNYPYREFKYSDINYLVLGRLVEKLSMQGLDDYIRKNILDSLGMDKSGFNMYANKSCKSLCAPTRKKMSNGHVHDPTSFNLGGVAGHAGLFATAKDLAKFSSIFLNDGKYCGKNILWKRSVKMMTTKKYKQSRGLGFDITSSYSTKPRGDYFSKGLSFGHTGFTGTSLWIDPSIDTFLIILSNSVYAKDESLAKKGFHKLMTELANIVGEAHSI